MDDLAGVAQYFQRKGDLWSSTDGSVAAHLRRLGRDGLVVEFRSDPGFEVVRVYLHRISDAQYVHDVRYPEFRACVRDSVFGATRRSREAQQQTRSIVRAALLAAGVDPWGDRLVRLAGALPRGSPPP